MPRPAGAIDISASDDLVEDDVIVASTIGIDILAPAGNTTVTGNVLGANPSDLQTAPRPWATASASR